MEIFLTSLTKLINVKSIMSLVTTFVFAYMAITGALAAEDVKVIISVVFTFFFSYQSTKPATAMEEKKE